MLVSCKILRNTLRFVISKQISKGTVMLVSRQHGKRCVRKTVLCVFTIRAVWSPSVSVSDLIIILWAGDTGTAGNYCSEDFSASSEDGSKGAVAHYIKPPNKFIFSYFFITVLLFCLYFCINRAANWRVEESCAADQISDSSVYFSHASGI